MISNFEIIPATLEDYPIVQNLARFYAYDLSRSCAFISDDWDFPENGLYESFDSKIYFEDPTRKVFLVRVDQELAGFALLNQEGTDEHTHWNMGEFFITAKFQGKNLGKQVAHQIWDKHPGLWEVSVIPENRPALHFWEVIINDYTGGNFIKEKKKIDYDKHQPERIIFSFDSHSKSGFFNL